MSTPQQNNTDSTMWTSLLHSGLARSFLTRERLREVGEEQHVGRSGQEEAPRSPFPVYLRLDRGNQDRRPLHLVQDQRSPETREETGRVRLGRGQNPRLVQRQVARITSP